MLVQLVQNFKKVFNSFLFFASILIALLKTIYSYQKCRQKTFALLICLLGTASVALIINHPALDFLTAFNITAFVEILVELVNLAQVFIETIPELHIVVLDIFQQLFEKGVLIASAESCPAGSGLCG